MIRKIKQFYYNVRRLIEYTPLIWFHRHWDHAYIFKIQIKLYKNLYKACYISGSHVVNPTEAKRLKTVIGLLERLSEENYTEEHRKWFEAKYGPTEYRFDLVPGSENKPLGPYSHMVDVRAESMTEKELKRYRAEQKRMYAIQDLQQKQDLKLLGDLIAKHCRKWWD